FDLVCWCNAIPCEHVNCTTKSAKRMNARIVGLGGTAAVTECDLRSECIPVDLQCGILDAKAVVGGRRGSPKGNLVAKRVGEAKREVDRAGLANPDSHLLVDFNVAAVEPSRQPEAGALALNAIRTDATSHAADAGSERGGTNDAALAHCAGQPEYA